MSSSYESAPATLLLATHCAVCSRPLVDAESVSSGIGPECKRKAGMGAKLPDDVRAAANVIIYRIARDQTGPDATRALGELAALSVENGGCLDKLVARITARLVTIIITRDGPCYLVATPFNPSTLDAWRQVPGRRWDGQRKVNMVPLGARRGLWSLLLEYYSGATASGPDGLFVVGG